MINRNKVLVLALAFSALTFYKGTSVSASTAYTGIRDVSAQQIVDDMKIGWNLGNTLDATGTPTDGPLSTEMSWGNPKTTHAMIDRIKAAGFNTVRIPTTWFNHMGSAPSYTIDPAWLNRVDEIMNYAFDNDMYVILNMHHEDSWLIPTSEKEAQVKNQLTKAWAQIANRFNKYGDHLIFETMNEPRPVGAANEWSGGSFENRSVINNYNLAAVNTIRNTGGNNESRCIMVPTLAASSTTVAVDDLVIPNDDKKIIVSLHMYSPYLFAMAQDGTDTWGSDADKSSLDWELDQVANKFVKKGHPVVIGEFGTINKNNKSSRVTHAEYYAKATRSRHITPVWWDNGISTVFDSNSYALLDRNTLDLTCPDIVSALMRGANVDGTTSSVIYDFEGSTGGWTATNTLTSPSVAWEWKHNGNNSLRTDITLTSGGQYYFTLPQKQDLTGKSELKAIVRTSDWGNQGTGMIAKLYVKTGDGYQWFDGGATKIDSSSTGTEIGIDLSKVSNLNDVREIGVQFIAGDNASWNSSLYMDYITVK
ncbi:glycoside hydrolase family 5 protein [Clostridium sp. SHJSY1]|uniref:glycoside hydrolase family 5 protein n=1 Tax=Clostridium sp. SHJSY1 TaxID=2942483 RepID=UPI002875C23D|nr:glycoside hydrolase family 5 protein [Clostridium sp. SHJSY1]MDS0524835.1 glycoside hydrolase family 5 protein [Clostridium sp. SHJSY1]